jgi:hypothetical protein
MMGSDSFAFDRPLEHNQKRWKRVECDQVCILTANDDSKVLNLLHLFRWPIAPQGAFLMMGNIYKPDNI